ELQRGTDAVQVQARRERREPLTVDVPLDGQELGLLAVEEDADIDELLAVGSGHASQDDVLVGQGTHASTSGSHVVLPNRASRKSTYASRRACGVVSGVEA